MAAQWKFLLSAYEPFNQKQYSENCQDVLSQVEMLAEGQHFCRAVMNS